MSRNKPKPMSCIICRHPSFKGARTSKFCPRCRKFARRGTWSIACLEAMIDAWDEKRQGFICKLSGLKLEDYNIHSPLYINFDHVVPGVEGKRQVVGNVLNVLKSDMDMDEFKAFCRALVTFWDTGVFDERVMNLKYWYRMVRRRAPVFRKEPYIDRSAKACVVCHKPAVPQSEFCRRHLKIRRRKGFCAAYREAMIKWWNEEAQGFLCRYTGIKLDEEDDHSPRYLNFDHLIPGGPVVVPAAAVINNMKSDLSEEEFRAIIRGLVGHWDGAEFNADLMRLKYWKR